MWSFRQNRPKSNTRMSRLRNVDETQPSCVFSGVVQRAYWSKDEHTSVLGPDLLPASEAHGGRQNSLARKRPGADPQQTTHGGQIQVSFDCEEMELQEMQLASLSFLVEKYNPSRKGTSKFV